MGKIAKPKAMTADRVSELRAAYELANKAVGFSSYTEMHAARSACIGLLGEAVTELERRQAAKVKSGGPQVVLTPKPFFDFLNYQGMRLLHRAGVVGVSTNFAFGFRWDLSAHPENALCPSFYTEQDDALIQPWHKLGGWLWNNPPYSNLGPWARKAWNECLLGARVVQLVKMTFGSSWFAKHVKGGPCTVVRMVGRLPFVGYGGAGANFDTMLIIWHGGEYSEIDWEWGPEVLDWIITTDYPRAELEAWNWGPVRKLLGGGER